MDKKNYRNFCHSADAYNKSVITESIDSERYFIPGLRIVLGLERYLIISRICCRLKSLGEGKVWSSSAPNLGKSPKHIPITGGFSSLSEMGESDLGSSHGRCFQSHSLPAQKKR